MGGSSSKVTPLDSLEDSSKRPENFIEVTARLSTRIKELKQQLELKNEASKSTEGQLQLAQQQVGSVLPDVCTVYTHYSTLKLCVHSFIRWNCCSLRC